MLRLEPAALRGALCLVPRQMQSRGKCQKTRLCRLYSSFLPPSSLLGHVGSQRRQLGNMDRRTSPAPAEDSGTPGRSSPASIIRPSGALNQATARLNAPTPRLLPSDVSNDDHHHHLKPPREAPALRYRRTPFWLALLYLTTLVVPWVLMCILNKQPLTAPSYYYQKGARSARNFLALTGVLAFINVLRAISGVIVIPITSVILAHAAVVYSQRRRHEQELNMRQLFALANRGWADPGVLWECHRQGSSSRLLWLGGLLLLLGRLGSIPPLIPGLPCSC